MMTRRKTTVLLTILTLASGLFAPIHPVGIPVPLASVSAAPLEEGTEAHIVRDVTTSYSYLDEGDLLVIDKVFKRCSPGARISISDLGTFSVDQVRFQRELLPLPASVDWGAPAPSFFAWKRRERILRTCWDRARKIQAECISWLEGQAGKQQQGGVTSLHTHLGYLSTMFSASRKQHKVLILYSDLVNCGGGKPNTRLPPEEQMDFKGVRIMFVFIHWMDRREWIATREAYSRFFAKGGATSFEMYDPASSRMLKAEDLLPPSSVPRTLPKFVPGTP